MPADADRIWMWKVPGGGTNTYGGTYEQAVQAGYPGAGALRGSGESTADYVAQRRRQIAAGNRDHVGADPVTDEDDEHGGGDASMPGDVPSNADKSAKSTIYQFLSQWGLGDLASEAWNKYLNGSTVGEIMLWVRGSPQYKRAYPAMDYLSQHGQAISEADYRNLETSYARQMHAYGIPKGFYDSPTDFAKLIENNVSPAEVGQRAQLAAQATTQVPDEVRQALSRDYGVGAGDLTAYFLDPSRAEPLLASNFAAAQVGGAGLITGYDTDRSLDERLASEGVDFGAAEKGFGQLQAQRNLFRPLVGTTETGIGEQAQIGATFENNAPAQRRIKRRAESRQAAFAGSGRYASGSGGIAGLGRAEGA